MANDPMNPEQRTALVLELWARHAEVGGLARALLGDAMPALRLRPDERQLIAGDFYRLFRLQRRIEAGLLLATTRPVSAPERARAAYLVSLVLDGEIPPEVAADRLGSSRVDFRRLAQLDEHIATEVDPTKRFGLTHSIPDWLAARFLAEFHAEADAIAAGLNRVPPLTVRTNTLKTDRATLARAFAAEGTTTAPTRHAEHGLIVDGVVNLFAIPAFRDGWFEQQDEASQLCARVVAPPPRGNVLDACAGAGGKTLALAAMLDNRGAVLATDVAKAKLDELVQRRRRAGTDNVRSVVTPPTEWSPEVAEVAKQADRILLDAPCGGVGAWRRRPDARWRLREEHLATVREKQRDLLDRALAHLQPGARAIYATCTIFREENEAQVEAALTRHPDIDVVPVVEVLGKALAAPLADPTGRFLQIWPHRHGADGFFAAVLRRRRLPRT